jgi:hypothetical protein
MTTRQPGKFENGQPRNSGNSVRSPCILARFAANRDSGGKAVGLRLCATSTRAQGSIKVAPNLSESDHAIIDTQITPEE